MAIPTIEMPTYIPPMPPILENKGITDMVFPLSDEKSDSIFEFKLVKHIFSDSELKIANYFE